MFCAAATLNGPSVTHQVGSRQRLRNDDQGQPALAGSLRACAYRARIPIEPSLLSWVEALPVFHGGHRGVSAVVHATKDV